MPNQQPQNFEAEKGVIGGILLTGSSGIDAVMDSLSAFDFYNQHYRKAYGVMLDLYNAGNQIDLVTVSDKLGEESVYTLGTAANEVHSAANLKGYAKIVRDKAVERELIKSTHKIQQIVAGDGDTRDKADKAEALILGVTE